MKIVIIILTSCIITQGLSAQTAIGKKMYEFDNNSTPRWSSFENIKAEKGKGGMENNGAKGHPADALAPGETKVLLNATGPGIINRLWVTVNDRSP